VTAPTMWNPPPAPDRDLWWQALRIAAPDAGDHTARHRRGRVRLPWELGERSGGSAGQVVEAWVCCDPQCGGVELDPGWLAIQHGCCDPYGPELSDRRHTSWGALWHVGWYHGPYTAWWEPDALVGGAR
jgi:hypothetical protein